MLLKEPQCSIDDFVREVRSDLKSYIHVIVIRVHPKSISTWTHNHITHIADGEISLYVYINTYAVYNHHHHHHHHYPLADNTSWPYTREENKTFTKTPRTWYMRFCLIPFIALVFTRARLENKCAARKT